MSLHNITNFLDNPEKRGYNNHDEAIADSRIFILLSAFRD